MNNVGEYIQSLRKQQGLSQPQLAEKSGVNLYTIQSYERTDCHHPNFDHAQRIARALGVDVLELLGGEHAESSKRKESLRQTPSLATLDLKKEQWVRHLLAHPTARAHEARSYGFENLLIPVRDAGLEARAHFKEGSREWAHITLRQCAQYSQQAGDVKEAQKYIWVVEKYYPSHDNSDPHISALVTNQRGWIEAEQTGHFPVALQFFAQSQTAAQEVGDPALQSLNDHLSFRCIVQQAMTEAGAWLVGRPTLKPLSSKSICEVEQALTTHWERAVKFDPENGYHYFWKHAALALVRPGEAQRELSVRASAFKKHGYTVYGLEHVKALGFARWFGIARDWSHVAGEAEKAFLGYCAARCPPEIAFSSAVWANALLQEGLRTPEQFCKCADLWVLTLLLQPFFAHPLWIEATKALRRINEEQPKPMSSYLVGLDDRVRQRESCFAALEKVYVHTFDPPSTLIYLSLLPAIENRRHA